MIRWNGPLWDASGYASAARDYVLALHAEGVSVTAGVHCFENTAPRVGVGQDKEVLLSLVDRPLEYDVVVSQFTPDVASAFREHGKYNINYFAWETTKVHPLWVDHLNMSDEIWVPSEWNVEALKSSGVTKPVTCIPHIARPEVFDQKVEPMFEHLADLYKFYSIFQWTERKNPSALLRSYFAAFSPEEPVVLVLKAYVGLGGEQDASTIANQVAQIKKDMGLPKFPKVVLVADRLTDAQMAGLHNELDCCVSLSHAEGFGLCPFEAAQAGNPVISTGAGGVMEFLDTDLSYLVSSQQSLVKGMSGFNRWYLGTGVWYDPCETAAISAMREVFDNKEAAAARGLAQRERIATRFSASAVVSRIKERLDTIRGGTRG